MAKKRVVPKAVGPKGKMRQQLGRKGGQARMRRELAAQRKAIGEAGVKRAMKKWGLREKKAEKRGGRSTITVRNG